MFATPASPARRPLACMSSCKTPLRAQYCTRVTPPTNCPPATAKRAPYCSATREERLLAVRRTRVPVATTCARESLSDFQRQDTASAALSHSVGKARLLSGPAKLHSGSASSCSRVDLLWSAGQLAANQLRRQCGAPFLRLLAAVRNAATVRCTQPTCAGLLACMRQYQAATPKHELLVPHRVDDEFWSPVRGVELSCDRRRLSPLRRCAV